MIGAIAKLYRQRTQCTPEDIILEEEELEQFRDFCYGVSEATLHREIQSAHVVESDGGNAVGAEKAAEAPCVITGKEKPVYPHQTPDRLVAKKNEYIARIIAKANRAS